MAHIIWAISYGPYHMSFEPKNDTGNEVLNIGKDLPTLKSPNTEKLQYRPSHLFFQRSQISLLEDLFQN